MALSSPTTDTTRQRLIEAAEPIFANLGYDGASVRNICQNAGANVAAVNYHFGDKRELYLETVKYAVANCCHHVRGATLPTDLSALEQLRWFIRMMVHGMLELPRPSAMHLMMRELAHPSEACTAAVEEFIRPMANHLRTLLRPLLPNDISELRLWMVGQSIVGQCLYYRQNRAVAERLMGTELFEQVNAEILSQHITTFTMAALGLEPSLFATNRESS